MQNARVALEQINCPVGSVEQNVEKRAAYVSGAGRDLEASAQFRLRRELRRNR